MLKTNRRGPAGERRTRGPSGGSIREAANPRANGGPRPRTAALWTNQQTRAPNGGPEVQGAERRRRELRTTNTDEHAMAAEASMGESSPAMASGTIATL